MSLKDAIAKKLQQLDAKAGKGEKTYKLKNGKTRLRILPSWKNPKVINYEEDYEHNFGMHFIKDRAGKVLSAYVCTSVTFDKECPLCNHVAEALLLADSDEDKAYFSSMKASNRVLVNAVIAEEGGYSEPVVLELPPSLFREIAAIARDQLDEEYPDLHVLTDLTQGSDIIIVRSGAGINTEYSVQIALKGSKPLPKDIMTRAKNLDDFVAQESQERLKMATTAIKTLMSPPSAPKKLAAKPAAISGEVMDDDVPDFAPSSSTRSIDDELDELDALLDDE